MKPETRWVGMVIGLLGLSVVIQGIAVFLSVGDPSFAIEPDYENKAVHYDDIRLQRLHNEALGWTVGIRATAGRPGDMQVDVILQDDAGRLIEDAQVGLEALHVARANRVLRADALPYAETGYRCALPMRRSGIWEFHVDARRGDEHFTAVVRETIACPDLLGSR